MNDLHSLPTSLREQLQTIADRISPPPPKPATPVAPISPVSQTILPSQTQVLARNDDSALAPAVEVIAQSNPELAALIIAARYGARAIEFEDLREKTKINSTSNVIGHNWHTTNVPYQHIERTVRAIRLKGSEWGGSR
jgi:hypothetical protein